MNTNRENSLFKHKIVYDITKFTHVDYPNHLACIVWFAGCNMRCDYCYNKDIVLAKSGNYSLHDVLTFLKSRTGMLDGVVLSGGEATNHDLIPLCQEIKRLGLNIKLDTNGTHPKQIQTLCELNLIDYIALDYKAPSYKYQEITKSTQFHEFSKTLQYLINSDMNFEVRTTLHSDLMNENDINNIIKDLQSRTYNKRYYIQNFLPTDDNIGNLTLPLKQFDKSKLIDGVEVVWR